MKEINFERKHFIKDLYNPKDIISMFDIIEFESFFIFKELAEKHLFHFETNSIIILPIDKENDYDAIIELFEKTNIDKSVSFILYIKSKNILENVMKKLNKRNFSIMIDFDIPCKIFDYFKYEGAKEWIPHNRFYKRVKINYSNYEKQFNGIVNTCGLENIRFFWTDIDYESFNEMKFGEMKDLAFSINVFKEYTIGKQPIVLNIKRNKVLKRIFVSDDMKLYLNNLKDDIWCFDLKEHLKDDGCSLDKNTLNKLRMYIDLKQELINTPYDRIYDSFYIDFYYNLKIEKVFNQVPLITTVFDRWLGFYGYNHK